MAKGNVLVTGVNGFVGPYLANELLGRGCMVQGIGYGPGPETVKTSESFTYTSCDLTNSEEVSKLDLKRTDCIIHLAGLASQAMSFEQPQRFIASNSSMLINVAEAAIAQKEHALPRLVVISSGAVYDDQQPMPLHEESKLSFNSPYTISKILNENLSAYYRKRGFSAVVVRPFNHTGPGQGPGFLIPELTAQVLSAGQGGKIAVGNLKTRRDYSDVRDIVRGYADIALAPALGYDTYNLCAGKSFSGEEILHAIARAAFGEKSELSVSVDVNKIRPNDPAEIYGDNSRVKDSLGWTPRFDISKTIGDYIAWFRSSHPNNAA